MWLKELLGKISMHGFTLSEAALSLTSDSIAILVTGFGTPVILTWLGYVPYMSGLLDKVRPFLVYPSLIGTYQVRPLPAPISHGKLSHSRTRDLDHPLSYTELDSHRHQLRGQMASFMVYNKGERACGIYLLPYGCLRIRVAATHAALLVEE